MLQGINFHKTRYRKASRYLAYFQTFSNTYAPLNKLRSLYGEALSVPDVIGIVIGTRPDCVDDEKLDYLAGLTRTHYVVVEYGMESCYNRTLERINRGHTVEQCIQALEATASRGLKTGIHLIFGLPGETRQEMLDQVEIINKLPVDTIKLHQLQIAKNTTFAEQYAENPEEFNMFGRDDYIDFVVKFLERLNPKIIVERFVNEMPPRYMAVEPGWGGIRISELWRLLEQRMEERNTWQGRIIS
jgi:hypothetical protein